MMKGRGPMFAATVAELGAAGTGGGGGGGGAKVEGVERGEEVVKVEQTANVGPTLPNDTTTTPKEEDGAVRLSSENGDVGVTRPKVEEEELLAQTQRAEGTGGRTQEVDTARTSALDVNDRENEVALLLREHRKAWKRKRRAESDAWRAEVEKTKFKMFGRVPLPR